MFPPKLILAPIDFSEYSNAALNVAADLAARYGAELLLVHVMPAVADLPLGVSIFREAEYDRGQAGAAAKRLAGLTAEIEQKNIKVHTAAGTANDVGMELVRVAEQNHADMIVMATHGMTGWRKIAFGSVAEKVVKEADCPVLVLRATAAGLSESKDRATSSAASR